MNGNPDLDRERLTSLFDDLSRELEFARTRVQIYVIGKPMKARAVEGLERISEELKTESRGRPSSRVDRARPSE